MSDIKTNNVLFTVPSTNNVNERITESELDNRVIDIATALSTIHGGATASDKKKGFWIGSNGNAVNEPVIEIYSDCTEQQAIDTQEQLKALAKTKRIEWGQESIRIASNGNTDFIDKDSK